MKNLIFCLFALAFVFTKAQNVNNYKYIQVPEKFSDFNAGQYQLNYYLKLLLKKNDYTILSENVSTWPEEARNNPCLVLNVDIFKVGKILKNALKVKFIDCKNAEVGSYEGISRIKEFDRGYQDALRLAMEPVGKYLPSSHNQAKSVPETNQTTDASAGIPAEADKNITETSMRTEFTNGENIVVLDQLKDGKYLLTNKADSSLIAQLQPSSRAGVFTVTVLNAKEKYTTTGFYDSSSLTIDFMENGRTKSVEFIKVSK